MAKRFVRMNGERLASFSHFYLRFVQGRTTICTVEDTLGRHNSFVFKQWQQSVAKSPGYLAVRALTTVLYMALAGLKEVVQRS